MAFCETATWVHRSSVAHSVPEHSSYSTHTGHHVKICVFCASGLMSWQDQITLNLMICIAGTQMI
jgi:hypothetical protein